MSESGGNNSPVQPVTYLHSHCALCGIPKEEGASGFMFCGRCRFVVYCSKEHQVAHYKAHKGVCRVNNWFPDSKSALASAACAVNQCPCKQWQQMPSSSSNSQINDAGSATSNNGILILYITGLCYEQHVFF